MYYNKYYFAHNYIDQACPTAVATDALHCTSIILRNTICPIELQIYVRMYIPTAIA